MALQSNTRVFIGGNPIHAFKRLMLRQDLDAHHYLELVCRMDVLEKASAELAEESRNFLGELLTVKVESLTDFQDYKTLEFKGVVTAVNSTKGFHAHQGDLVTIKAQSCSILADDGPHYASFNDVGLEDILHQTFQGYDQGKLELSLQPVYSEALHYSVQQHESAYQYASRLAAQYSEWFYYDGKTLHFGLPQAGEEVTLTYGHDLQEFSLNLNPVPNAFSYFTNDYLTDGQHEAST
ncbi:contractile injection system protein, VgrG/Pvc8 family, partial [Gangjinia marincola]|uniref:contractile injection system protein, VgrG/Pvc8 family n=1 Tax=Gangjinia marincola TaxID=578463 RepID=UPI0031DCFC55